MGKIAELIKYEGDNSTFIWKHPCEDFNSMTQLVVHESQEAIFLYERPGPGPVLAPGATRWKRRTSPKSASC